MFIEVYFVTNDGECGMTKVYSPEGKTVSLSVSTITAASGAGWTKSKQFAISGSKMTYVGYAGESGIGPNGGGTNYMGSILVTAVVGCVRL